MKKRNYIHTRTHYRITWWLTVLIINIQLSRDALYIARRIVRLEICFDYGAVCSKYSVLHSWWLHFSCSSVMQPSTDDGVKPWSPRPTRLNSTKLFVELSRVGSGDVITLKTQLNKSWGPKLQFVLRASSCCDHPPLRQFDDLLHLALKQSCNIALTYDLWTKASLPVWSGGLGVQSVLMLASSAFLASADGTLPLQTHILKNTQMTVEDTSSSLKHWLSISGLSSKDSLPVGNQRMLDSIVINHTFQTLLEIQTTQYHRARLLAAKAVHSGDWLHAVPISSRGLRLNN